MALQPPPLQLAPQSGSSGGLCVEMDVSLGPAGPPGLPALGQLAPATCVCLGLSS